MSAAKVPVSPPDEAPLRNFWDGIADKYARQPIADEAAYRYKLEVTRSHLRPDMHMLEFGCGTGSTALVHAPHVRRIQALDISARMIEIARDKAAAKGVRNVAFEQSTLDAYASPDACFDIVLGMSILHLLDDPRAAIERVHRLLKPGGLFVSTTPCLGSHLRYAPLRLVLPVLGWLGKAPLVRFLSERRLIENLRQTGFDIEHEWKPRPAGALFLVAKKAG